MGVRSSPPSRFEIAADAKDEHDRDRRQTIVAPSHPSMSEEPKGSRSYPTARTRIEPRKPNSALEIELGVLGQSHLLDSLPNSIVKHGARIEQLKICTTTSPPLDWLRLR